MASPPYTAPVENFFWRIRRHQDILEDSERKNFYSDMIVCHLKVDRNESGRIYCTLKVDASCANPHNTLHGGVVASVAAEVGLACAKMMAGEEFFLGEHNTAYLAAAGINAEIEVEGCILRKGRSVIVTCINFRIKESKKLAYTTRSTYYVMPVASL
ncbi:hypothetical protein KSP39_PZI000785 [Platanthera zijinensis]|uniref:Thioesterase domain-containing protein n=1 Tax=Platanthera zijinensis TaxID=2320716 RepID=A0AAP0C075_9ASPA